MDQARLSLLVVHGALALRHDVRAEIVIRFFLTLFLLAFLRRGRLAKHVEDETQPGFTFLYFYIWKHVPDDIFRCPEFYILQYQGNGAPVVATTSGATFSA